MCTSWASYSLDKVTELEDDDDDVFFHSRQCAAAGGTAEYKTKTGDGGMLFVCVRDRTKNCEQGSRV